MDLATTTDLASILVGAQYVVHLAARSGGITLQMNDPTATFLHNVRVTSNVLRASEAAGVERVFLASSAVVYRQLPRPIAEGDPIMGLRDRPSGYAWSKICDEVQAGWRTNNLDVVIGRFTNVYGPGGGGRSTVVHDLVDRAIGLSPGDELVVWGKSEVVRSFINVADAARAVVSVTTRAERGCEYNIDTGDGIAIGELAALIRDLVEPSLRIRFDDTKPSGDLYRVLRPDRLNSLGYRALVSLESGLNEVIASRREAIETSQV
jgi:GDP-L-fucose synthase